jgi:hypothetical protein
MYSHKTICLLARRPNSFYNCHIRYLTIEEIDVASTVDFKEEFERMMPMIRKDILKDFEGLKSPAGLDYKTIWSHFQKTSAKRLTDVIAKRFPGAETHVTKTKSGFPDIKITYRNRVYAIDVKSGASKMDPWYDIARLDTIFKERLEKYDEEYDIVIKYDQTNGMVENVFFEPMYKTVGKDPNSKGVKFRPYDGKLRPKSWEMFEKGEAYWASKVEFIEGVNRSLYYRMKIFIRRYWKELPEKERAELRSELFQHFRGEA